MDGIAQALKNGEISRETALTYCSFHEILD